MGPPGDHERTHCDRRARSLRNTREKRARAPIVNAKTALNAEPQTATHVVNTLAEASMVCGKLMVSELANRILC